MHDLDDAPAVRRENLRQVLHALKGRGTDTIWFGRDLGYRGGRRTGLSLTDEGRLAHFSRLLGHASLRRATVGLPIVERTASVVWGVIDRMPAPPVLWNAFPLHPHVEDDPMSNRAHSRIERRATEWTIRVLIETFAPKQVIAIGNDAKSALNDLGVDCTLVRHPSYGGQGEFVATMERLYCLPPTQTESQPRLL